MFTSCLLATALALGSWGARGCMPVGLPSATAHPSFEWRSYRTDPGRSYLFRDGVQAAGYDHDHAIYRVYDAETGVWGTPQSPPWETHEKSAAKTAVPNYGVDTDKLNGRDEESYRINGTPVSREQANKALAGSRIPDDAARLRLTLIGNNPNTERVVHDLANAPALAEWKDKLVLQRYAPDHWSVAQAGFVTTGQPTIYLQAPDGKVLHRQDDYQDGPEGLARALRRADPNYDSKKDPDLRKLPARPHLDLSAVPTPLWILAAGFFYLLLRRQPSKVQP